MKEESLEDLDKLVHLDLLDQEVHQDQEVLQVHLVNQVNLDLEVSGENEVNLGEQGPLDSQDLEDQEGNQEVLDHGEKQVKEDSQEKPECQGHLV